MDYDPSTKTITIDPRSGLDVGGGKVQTPALGYRHEADHALQDIKNPTQFAQDAQTKDAAFDDKEERRTIAGSETPAALKAGEPTRNNHGGTAVQVKCPTCDK